MPCLSYKHGPDLTTSLSFTGLVSLEVTATRGVSGSIKKQAAQL